MNKPRPREREKEPQRNNAKIFIVDIIIIKHSRSR